MAAYTLKIPKEFYDAIEWHGGRYETTDRLLSLADPDPADPAYAAWEAEDAERRTDGRLHFARFRGGYIAEMSESTAWELREAWENDGGCFACGSPDLNAWFQDFIDSIV